MQRTPAEQRALDAHERVRAARQRPEVDLQGALVISTHAPIIRGGAVIQHATLELLPRGRYRRLSASLRAARAVWRWW